MFWGKSFSLSVLSSAQIFELYVSMYVFWLYIFIKYVLYFYTDGDESKSLEAW